MSTKINDEKNLDVVCVNTPDLEKWMKIHNVKHIIVINDAPSPIQVIDPHIYNSIFWTNAKEDTTFDPKYFPFITKIEECYRKIYQNWTDGEFGYPCDVDSIIREIQTISSESSDEIKVKILNKVDELFKTRLYITAANHVLMETKLAHKKEG